jgi:DNA-binding NarL/FixJ family response regulator
LKRKVVIAEDHVVVREALKTKIEADSDFEVVGQTGDGRSAIQLVEDLRPEVVIMDIALPKLNGIEATRQIKADHPEVQVLALSMYSQSNLISELLRAGGTGFLIKNCSSEELILALTTVAAGQTYLSPSIAGVVVDGFLRPDKKRISSAYSRLSPREREVLQLLAEGQSAKEVASQLHISLSTVETHRRQLKRKLGLDSYADLVKFAIREGLTSLEP